MVLYFSIRDSSWEFNYGRILPWRPRCGGTYTRIIPLDVPDSILNIPRGKIVWAYNRHISLNNLCSCAKLSKAEDYGLVVQEFVIGCTPNCNHGFSFWSAYFPACGKVPFPFECVPCMGSIEKSSFHCPSLRLRPWD